jgi:hypothetical protein
MGTRPKKPSSSRGFARQARGARGVGGFWGFWGLKTENRKLKIEKILSLSKPAQTRFLPRPRTVKTRPWVKPRPQGKRGRPDGNFPPISSFMTSLTWTAASVGPVTVQMT